MDPVRQVADRGRRLDGVAAQLGLGLHQEADQPSLGQRVPEPKASSCQW